MPEPPESRFDLLVIGLGVPFSEVGLLEQMERIRVHLRREISKRLIESARAERVEAVCRNCGEPTDVSVSYFEKVARGQSRCPCASTAPGQRRRPPRPYR